VITLARNLNILRSCFLTFLTAVFVTRLRQAPAWQVGTLGLLICHHHRSPFVKDPIPKISPTPSALPHALFIRRSAQCPQYEFHWPVKLGRLRNWSERAMRIAIGSRRLRTAGLFPLGRTAMHSPSSKGSETISKWSPYIFHVRRRGEAEILNRDEAIGSNLHGAPPFSSRSRLGPFRQSSYVPTPRWPFLYGRFISELFQLSSSLSLRLASRGRSSPFQSPL
jgi:hypothetical protein